MTNLQVWATIIGSHLTRKPTTSPVLTKCWNWELTLTTNFGSHAQMVTKFGGLILATKLGFVPDCWCCGDLCRQAISSHDIDLLYKLDRSLSYMRRDFNYLWHVFLQINFPYKELNMNRHSISVGEWPIGPRFNIKMSSYQYRKSHCGDKTVVRSSYLHNGISYTGKMLFLYWIGAQNITMDSLNI